MGAASSKPRRLITVVARTVLALLLLAQLAVLWVVTHAAPTRLPTALVDALGEVVSGRMDFDCREATVDRRGRIRLGGVRLSDPAHPGDGVSGDIDVLPDWLGCLGGQPRLLALQIRARASAGEGAAAGRVDDLVLRLGRIDRDEPAELQAAARIGTLTLRLHALGKPAPARGDGDAGMGDLAPTAWNRELAIDALRLLRSLDGAIGLTVAPGSLAAEGGFAENPAAVSPLPLRIESGRLSGCGEAAGRIGLVLNGVHLGGARASRAWVALDRALRLKVVAEGLRIDGLDRAHLVAEGRWQPDAPMRLRLHAGTPASRLEGEMEFTPSATRLRGLTARVAAEDLAGLSPIAGAARAVGVDLCGMLELRETEASWENGALNWLRGDFAFGSAGWGDLRPSLVRPEERRPVFQGHLDVDLAGNRLALTRLDLAGIVGEIRGGLRAGDAFDLRLSSTEGRPVSPPCLNSLLGSWWVDLWSRFDLSTHGTRPEADVRVRGRWGHPESIVTTVRSTLRNFGFMNARFLETDLWVFADAQETRVHIDQLRGELDGRDAGAAKGNLRWDWQRKERRGEPELLMVGELDPLCALRMYDPAAATRLRGWDFGKPNILVAVGPDRPLEVSLHATQPAKMGGIPVERYTATAQLDPATQGRLVLDVHGEIEGGQVKLKLTGNLASDNRIELTVDHWSRTGAERLIARLRGSEPAAAKPDNTLLSLRYTGRCDFATPWATEGEGRVRLTDPELKTLRLLGPLSSALDLLGLSFSSYNLNQAEAVFECSQGIARLQPLRLEGDDALVNLGGTLDLQSGGLRLKGGLKLKDSGWGPLKILNPNRLIANMISIDVGGNVNKPEVKAKIVDVNIIK